MKHLFSLLVICLLALAFVACNKEPLPTLNSSEKIASAAVQAFGFTDEEITAIGDIHDYYLKASYEQLSTNSPMTERNQLGEYFSNLNIDLSKLSHTPKSLYSMSLRKYEIMKENNYLLTESEYDNHQVLNDYLQVIYNAVDQTSSFKDFRERMDLLYHNVKSDTRLTEFEAEAVKVTISVAKSSVRLWMPSYMGGEGLSPPSTQHAKWNWGNAVLGDISGAMSAMAELGIAGAVLGSVPGTNAAIALAVGVSSGIGSAIGGLV